MADFPRIVFYGTPQIAVASLRRLVSDEYPIAAVVTAPDKPAGRGLRISVSPVKEFAVQNGLRVLQPIQLKDPQFLSELRSLAPDLQVVVAFRMMPRDVWSLPPLGTFNLHASVLPAYRGAAPINWAIIRGEKETGMTTFFLEDKMDTGEIIFMEKTPIGPAETAGELHDRLMEMGAGLVSKTVSAIASGTVQRIPQSSLAEPLPWQKTAPKFSRDDSRIDWNQDLSALFNRIRGLSPIPGAFADLVLPDGTCVPLKILNAEPEPAAHNDLPGSVHSDGKTFLKVSAPGGYLRLLQVLPAGRRIMEVAEFLRGYHRHILENPR